MARVCEQAERFPEMLDFLKPVFAEKGPDLSQDERNLYSVACKNLLSHKRTVIRTISQIEGNPKYSKFRQSLRQMLHKFQQAILNDCEQIIEQIQDNVLSKASQDEQRSFFLKMTGDYYRYMCEIATGDKLALAKDEAKKNYEEASLIEMPSCSPVKLGLALNYSVFYYEVFNDRPQACFIADQALNQALEKIDDLGENEFRDVKGIIELMKENLSIWQQEEAAA